MAFGSMPFRGNDVRLNDDSEKWRLGLLVLFHLTIRIYENWVKWRSAMSFFGETSQWNEVPAKQRVGEIALWENDVALIKILIKK